MSAQSLASFCCSSLKCWCSCASSQEIARAISPCQRVGATLPARRRWSTAISHHSVASMQPRYQKSASRPSGSTYFGIWPLAAYCAASAARLATAPCSSAATPLPHIAIAQIAASRPKIRV